MIDINAVHSLQRSSVTEKIRVIEILLQSLKDELQAKRTRRKNRPKTKTFHVRKFNLGEEVHVDRDELYSERIR